MALDAVFVGHLRLQFSLPIDAPIEPDTNFLELIGQEKEEQLTALKETLAYRVGRKADPDTLFNIGMSHENPADAVTAAHQDIDFGRPGTVQRLQAMHHWAARVGISDNGSD